MSIDLCIVNYNTENQLRRLYATLVESATLNDVDFTINIADNGSVDGSRSFLMQLKNHNLATVCFNENIGYASACNQLAAMGQADIIALLNSDVWFTHQNLTAIQKAFDENPEIAILGPKQRNETGHITHGGIFGSHEQPEMRGWKQSDPTDSLYRDLEEAVTVSGSAYFIRRSVWDDLTNCSIYKAEQVVINNDIKGAFLPTQHYYEETFCSYHASAHGYKVFYDGRVSIGHSWHASHPVGSPMDKMFHVSRELFRTACENHGIVHD